MDEKELQKLYDAISSHFDIGDFNQFKSRMQTPEQRKSFYDVVGKQGFDVGEYPDYETRLAGVKKKDVGGVGSIAGGLVGVSNGLSDENKTDIRNYVIGDNSKERNSQISQKIQHQKIITQSQLPKIPSDKDISNEAVRRFQDPNFSEAVQQSNRERGLTDLNEDPIGNFISHNEIEKNSINSSVFDEGANPIEAQKEIAVREKQNQLLKDNFFPSIQSANDFLNSVKNKNTITGKIASERVDKANKLSHIINSSATLDEAAAKYFGVDSPVKGQQGVLTEQFLNDRDVQEISNNDPSVKEKYKEANYNLYANDPDYAVTKVKTKLAQAREDLWENSLLANNPSVETTDKLAEKLLHDGKTPNGEPFDERDMFYYNKAIRPVLEKAHSVGAGSDIIPTTGALESFTKGISGGFEGIASSMRDVSNKVTGGIFKKVGLLENDEDRRNRLLQEDYTTPTVEAKSNAAKIISGSSGMVGYITPMILGQFVGVPSLVTNTLMFEGANADNALKLFKDNPVKRFAYTLAGTGLDVALAEALPTKEAAGNVKSIFKKDLVATINDFYDKKITAAAAKQTLLDKLSNLISDQSIVKGAKFLGKTGVENLKTTGIITGFGLIHNTLNSIFGGSDMTVQQIADQTVKDYKANFFSALGLSAIASAKFDKKVGGKIIREAVENPDFQNEIDKTGDEEVINNYKNAVQKWGEIKDLNLTEPQKEQMLIHSLAEDIHKKAAEQSNVSAIKNTHTEKAKQFSEVQKDILNPEDNSKEIENLKTNNDLDNKEIDIRIKELDKESATYSVQKQKLEQKRKEKNEDYEAKIKELSKSSIEEPLSTTPEESQSVPIENGNKTLNEAKELALKLGDDNYTTEPLKEAAKNNEGKFKTYLKNIAEQSQDPASKETTISSYGQDLVDKANELFPDEEKFPTEDEFKKADQIVSSHDAESRLSNGERIFAVPEMDEQPIEIKNVGELKGYTPDQLISIQRKEDPFVKADNSVADKDYEDFKDHILETILNVKDNKFTPRISSSLDYKTREQAIRNIREGKDTKAARTLLSEIKEMYDDGFVKLNTAAGGLSQTFGIPIKEYMAEINKPLKIEDLDELNTLLGEDTFNSNFDNAYDNETKRATENTETSTVASTAAGKNIEATPSSESPTSVGEKTQQKEIIPPTTPIQPIQRGGGSGITHEATEATRKEFGLGEFYEKTTKHDEDLRQQAEQEIKKGYNIEKLVGDIEGGKQPSDIENTILKIYKSGLEARIEKDPSTENLNELRRFVKATDKIGSETGRSLRSRQGLEPRDESLAGYFTREQDVNLDAPLTDNQKETVKTEWENINKAKKDFDDYVSKKEEELSNREAEKAVKKEKSTVKKTNKTHEDFVKERGDIIQHMRDKLKQSRGETSATLIPYAKELIAIAPDVAKLTRSLLEEGAIEFSKLVDAIHENIKELIPQATRKDSLDLLAGEYNEKSQPKNELARRLFEARQQAQLINKLERLKSGEEPKNEKQKIKRNQEIESLRQQIKDYRKQEREANKFSPEEFSEDAKQLNDYKSKIQKQIKRLEEDLKTGNFLKAEKKKQIPLDDEAKKLQYKLIKLKTEREVRLMKQSYENRSRVEKTRDWVIDKLNVPRTIMASMDYSAPLRQGLVAGISHPTIAAKASIEMFKASFSQKNFDRWMYEMRESPEFEIMNKSGLSITDPHNPYLAAKEEAFMNNTAEKIPLIGKLIKGSERAYVMFLNKMRVDLFKRFVDRFEEQGKTFENSPEVYKAAAKLINAETGRGNLPEAIESAAPILNTVFFSPRLIASRVNLLTNWANPFWYKNTPKEIRVEYMKDMLKFVATGVSILTLAKLSGAQVEDDPRSTDFGKIKSGNTRWDIWGGFQQYARLFTQIALGEKKSTGTGEIQQLDSKGRFGESRTDVFTRFVRGKLAPVPSMAIDFVTKRDATGQPVTLGSEAQSHLLPLLYSDIKQAVQEKGISAMFTVGIPATFGVGVQTYSSKQKKQSSLTNQPLKVQ